MPFTYFVDCFADFLRQFLISHDDDNGRAEGERPGRLGAFEAGDALPRLFTFPPLVSVVSPLSSSFCR